MPEYERLSAMDASFLEVEDHATHMHVAAVLIFERGPLARADGGLEIERVRRLIASRLHLIPRYRQRLARIPVERHPVWVDDRDFNLHYHVRHTALPRPGDDRQLKRLVGRITSQKLDPSKPLWEMWVTEGLEDGRFAIIAKAHHCMVDGVSGIDVLATLLRDDPDPTIEPAPAWVPRPTPTGAELFSGELLRRAAAPFAAARRAGEALRDPRAAWDTARQGASALAETLGSGLQPASATPLNPDHIGPHRRFDGVRLDLAAVKDVKNRLGGTVNDVVLATTTGALGRFLRARGVRSSGLDLRALVPVSTRRPDERGALGNRVAMMIAPLPVGDDDPRRRLERVTETTRRLKSSKQPRGMELLEEIGDRTTTGVITQIVRLAARVRTYNLVVTNVPGPREPLYLLGARLLAPYPVVPLYSNQALGIALFSYHDGLYWGLSADWDRVPDLHDFARGLSLSFEELHKAATAV